MAIIDDLHTERAKYGPTMTDDQCVELCNAVAWKHRTDGWGLSGKTGGTRGRRYDGAEVAHDILHHFPSNTLYDVLVGAGAQSTPVFNNVGAPGPGRPWVAPIAPQTDSGGSAGGGGSEPVPGPSVDLKPVLDAIAGVRANDDDDHQTLANLLGAVFNEVNGLRHQLDAIQAAVEAIQTGPPQEVEFPVYTSNRVPILGTVTLTPKK
jgi:hypothetical protein